MKYLTSHLEFECHEYVTKYILSEKFAFNCLFSCYSGQGSSNMGELIVMQVNAVQVAGDLHSGSSITSEGDICVLGRCAVLPAPSSGLAWTCTGSRTRFD